MAESGARLQLVDDHAQRQDPDLPREPLWRHLLGGQIRTLRRERGETLVETARRAGVSSQYLSEIERGLKEPSSEVIAAVARALEVTLLDLTVGVAQDIRSAQTRAVRRNAVRTLDLHSTQVSAMPINVVRGGSSSQVLALAA